MINSFVEFGFQPLNMKALLDFELKGRGSIFNNFQARDTIILTIFEKTKMLKNMIIFIPEKVLIYRSVEIPVVPVIFLVKFFNLFLHKVQFPPWKTKYFLGQFMTADDMHDRSTCWFSKCRGLSASVSFLSRPIIFFVTLKILISCYSPPSQ